MAKYATPEERNAALAMKARARWTDPEFRAKASLVNAANSAKAVAASDCLCPADLKQFLSDYVERDPNDRRRYRYTAEQLAKRYLLAVSSVWSFANRNGAWRTRKQPRQTKTEREREERLQEAFKALCEIAQRGDACPGATTPPLFHGALTALARRGLIRVEMTMGCAGSDRATKNFYRVVILKGPAAGAETARDVRSFTPCRIIARKTLQRATPTHPSDILQRRLEARA